jgi:hypothetical protein
MTKPTPYQIHCEFHAAMLDSLGAKETAKAVRKLAVIAMRRPPQILKTNP